MEPHRWILWVMLAVSAPVSAQHAYSGVVVFGTSLSDPGNAFALRGELNTPPDFYGDFLLIPSAPYARGGLHLSNGAPWIVQLAQSLGLARSVRPAYRDENPNATNYAVDRARARDDGLNVNLSDQVSQFLLDSAGVAPADRLYVIEIGSSDVRDALATYLLGSDGSVVIQAALSSITTQLRRLYAAGARDFLILSVPDISLTPAVRTVDALYTDVDVAEFASGLTQTFNAALDDIVEQLPADTDVARLDLYGKLYEIVASPASFGLTDVMNPCITPELPPFRCRHPDEYLFWDGVHPTEAVHEIFAREAELVLGL